VEIYRSAFRHGVSAPELWHAFGNAITWVDLGFDERWLAARAMSLRSSIRPLLPPGPRE